MRLQLTILRNLAVRLALCAGLVALAAAPGRAEIAPEKLPLLTGRVVDDAHVLKPEDQQALSAKLKDLEDQSGIQFVVATVASLQGEEIEPYANALFRKWKLGQKDKNNGVLFLIAPTEHKLRFEVGYGLEGTLTDATTKLILHNAVGPKLKANDFAGGINAGVNEAIAVLTTDKASWQKRPALQTAPADQPLSTTAVVLILIGGLIFLIVLYRFRGSINWTSLAAGTIIGNAGGGGGSSPGGGSSDNFSGGGGDSGGGGSSDSY
ncbi:YgcG family protein [Beijerinckia sp. L45]|uniref:TPM domain-containing protein n=1 Tax=Beijerinckia sp. L45 TaxID=1641855 RepID=UPI00131EAF76|nr:TPM domain-containing protein [Beijerinckia sp. L45]